MVPAWLGIEEAVDVDTARPDVEVTAMPTLELIELYPSPYSERLRWVLDL